MNDLTIIKDYRGAFYSSTLNIRLFCSMNLERLCEQLSTLGWTINLCEFPDINFQDNWSSKVVIYQSAEDPDLNYKSYIEDVILGLSLSGAKLLPSYPFLRAHHNKVFMEILRKIYIDSDEGTLISMEFGTLEDMLKKEINYPVVMKSAESSGSRGVKLLHDFKKAKQLVRKSSRSRLSLNLDAREYAKRIFLKGYVPYSLNRHKFVLQQFIPNLSSDFKVLIYWDQVFVLQRAIRENDFRASGSGKFSFPRQLPKGFLDFVWKIFQAYDTPIASLDIAATNNRFYLLEAQFIDFGTYTLEKSPYHWYKKEDDWIFVEGGVELESIFAKGITKYATKKGWYSNLC